MNTEVDTTKGCGYRQTTSQSFSETYFYQELARFRTMLGEKSFWDKTEEQRDAIIRGLGYIYFNVVPNDNTKVTQEMINKWSEDYQLAIGEYNRRHVMLTLHAFKKSLDVE